MYIRISDTNCARPKMRAKESRRTGRGEWMCGSFCDLVVARDALVAASIGCGARDPWAWRALALSLLPLRLLTGQLQGLHSAWSLHSALSLRCDQRGLRRRRKGV